jgi:hypothetical protein
MALETTANEAGLKARGHALSTTRIAGNTRANVKGLWFFAVLWNVVSAPVLVYIPPELARQPVAALGFLFPIVGVGLIAWALVTTARSRRFGETWLDTTRGAARPGSTWHAAVMARLPQPDSGDGYTVSLKLSCLQRTISRSSDDSSEKERILWREETEIDSSRIAFGGEHASIPVRFVIPADALVTTAVGKGEGVLWVLTAEAALPGVNLKEDFDVPVRRTIGGPEGPQPHTPGGPEGAQPQPRSPSAIVSVDDLARSGVTVQPAPGGMAFRYARMRNVPFAIGITAFTALWTGALWVQIYLGFPWIFPILTGLFDLLLGFITLELWLGTTTVTAAAGELRVHHTLLGIGGTRVLAAADIASIELHIGMQTTGRYGTPYYDIRARRKNGRKQTLGSGVRNKRHAEWLAAQMRAAVGIK